MNARNRLAYLLILLAAATSPAAQACSCSRNADIASARDGSDVVFAGTVVDVRYVEPLETFNPRVIVRLKVARVWKGPVDHYFTLHTVIGGGICAGMERALAQPGETLIVYAHGYPAAGWKKNSFAAVKHPKYFVRSEMLDAVKDDATVYSTSICSRTKLARGLPGEEDLRELGEYLEFEPLVIPRESMRQ
jgi:hypothetical protein